MTDQNKGHDDLIRQIEDLNARLAEREGSEVRRQQAERALESMAHLDEATGLYNRSAFLLLAVQQLRIARRAERPMLLLYCKADPICEAGESAGAAEADRSLAEAGRVLEQTFRESDVVARIGEREFAVLAVEAVQRRGLILANRLRKALADQKARGALHPDFSFHTALARWDPQNPCTAMELLERAQEQARRQTHFEDADQDEQ